MSNIVNDGNRRVLLLQSSAESSDENSAEG